ncbi:hypothetical protein GCK32_002672 [Trichostrongylus colubriformis]|uniref:CCHC-type domain-containing protein n=1 Tax=Trichostrongylus colubriformis TaxID=6319 RepID=A0AAN8IQJ3_TRICO
MLKCGKDYVTTELKILRRVDKKEEKTALGERRESRMKRLALSSAGKGYVCFYCDRRDHTPKECNMVKTRKERLETMQKKMLCRNCRSKDHMAKQCSAGACRLCGIRGHHTSVCQQLSGQLQRQSTTASYKSAPQTKRPSRKVSSPQTAATTKVHPALFDAHPASFGGGCPGNSDIR